MQLGNVSRITSSSPLDVSIGLDRTKRVKDARSEAQKEIEEYRKQKEEGFKKFESEVCMNPNDPCRRSRCVLGLCS